MKTKANLFKWLFIVFMLQVVLCPTAKSEIIFGNTGTKYSGGSGEPNNPYQIATAQDLIDLGNEPNDYDKHFILTADIDLAGYTGTAFHIIGTEDNPFTGIFKGNDHNIINFTCSSAEPNDIGLFGYVGSADAEIRNLGLIDPNIIAVDSTNVGSLVGHLEYGYITQCSVTGGRIEGNEAVGGLVGYNYEGIIKISYATANVYGNVRIGGLVGENEGRISTSYATGDVCGGNRSGSLGGLVGINKYSIEFCYATGNVSCGEDSYMIGGLAGSSESWIVYCYATGEIPTGDGTHSIGGLVGFSLLEGETILGCFWDMETSSLRENDGVSEMYEGVTGLTTAQMYDPNNFTGAGWDFIGKSDGPGDIWAEPDGSGYPVLWWQLSPLPELPGFSGGSGKQEDPYLISSVEELNSIGYNPRLMDKSFKLVDDIDLNDVNFFAIGNGYFPFEGVFDGNGHTISSFTYIQTDRDIAGTGFFGYIYNAEVRDLGLVDPNVDAWYKTTRSTFSNVGSLVGVNMGGTVVNCCTKGGRVIGDYTAAGLIGENTGLVKNCYSSTFVIGSYAAGLVGLNDSGIDWTGGTITNCYSTGIARGMRTSDGLVDSYFGTVNNSFWDMEASDQPTSTAGEGKSTAEMQAKSTFTNAGWDFVGETVNGTEDIWWIDEGQDYPRLCWETN